MFPQTLLQRGLKNFLKESSRGSTKTRGDAASDLSYGCERGSAGQRGDIRSRAGEEATFDKHNTPHVVAVMKLKAEKKEKEKRKREGGGKKSSGRRSPLRLA